MKRKLPIIVASVLVSAMAFSSCGSTNNVQNEQGSDIAAAVVQKTPEEEVIETATNFMDALCSYDTDTLKKYSDEDVVENIEEGLKFNEMKDVMNSSGFFTEEKVDYYTDKIYKGLFKMVDYEIGDADVDGNEATVDVVIEVPDFSLMDSSSLDYAELMSEAFGFDVNDGATLLSEYSKKKGKSIDELTVEMAGASQNEIIDDILSAFDTEMDKYIDLMLDEIHDISKTSKTEKTKGELLLEKQADNSWKVIDMDD